jgi:hypothetical protein
VGGVWCPWREGHRGWRIGYDPGVRIAIERIPHGWREGPTQVSVRTLGGHMSVAERRIPSRCERRVVRVPATVTGKGAWPWR